MENVDAKILLKISDPDMKVCRWVHLCYADGNIYSEYMLKHSDLGYMNGVIAAWAEKDFGVNLAMNSMEDILTLKNLVKDFYKEKYPEIYRDSNTDRQGWLRLWINNKMREELDSVNG